MNKKFFELSEERQNAIINAGCKVFSKYGYKKPPMSEIALEAGIYRALIFHYFRNKKEYYLYLYNYSTDLLLETDGVDLIKLLVSAGFSSSSSEARRLIEQGRPIYKGLYSRQFLCTIKNNIS